MVNAFWLAEDVDQAAAWLVDAHVTSSVFECSMVLTTAVQEQGYPREESLYHTHADNPLTVWAASSFANWERLHEYTAAAHEEWRYRWDHDADDDHGCWAVVETLDREVVQQLDWLGTGLTDPPQLTGDWSDDSYVDAYRYYYANEKRHLYEWSKDRTAPPWIDEYTIADAGEDQVADESD